MLKLVDRHVSEACAFTGMRVQVSPSAHYISSKKLAMNMVSKLATYVVKYNIIAGVAKW